VPAHCGRLKEAALLEKLPPSRNGVGEEEGRQEEGVTVSQKHTEHMLRLLGSLLQ
jgi:hypothetical protein